MAAVAWKFHGNGSIGRHDHVLSGRFSLAAVEFDCGVETARKFCDRKRNNESAAAQSLRSRAIGSMRREWPRQQSALEWISPVKTRRKFARFVSIESRERLAAFFFPSEKENGAVWDEGTTWSIGGRKRPGIDSLERETSRYRPKSTIASPYGQCRWQDTKNRATPVRTPCLKYRRHPLNQT